MRNRKNNEGHSIPELEDLLFEDLPLDPELERLFESFRAEMVKPPPTLHADVMRRVRAISRSPWRRGVIWLTAPKTLHVRPLTAALAAAALLAGVMVTVHQQARETVRDPSVAAAEATTRFVFVAPGASQVAVTGDFVDWDPDGIPLANPGSDGVWVAEVPLSPGLYHYVFIVDGEEWRPDPNATSQVDDGFGRQNSLLLVPSPQRS